MQQVFTCTWSHDDAHVQMSAFQLFKHDFDGCLARDMLSLGNTLGKFPVFHGLVTCFAPFGDQNSQSRGVCLFWGVVVFCQNNPNEHKLKSTPCSLQGCNDCCQPVMGMTSGLQDKLLFENQVQARREVSTNTE